MATLRTLKEQGFGITLYCQRIVCHHSWDVSFDQLIQYFGADYELVTRAGWDRLVCEKCGHRGASVILGAPGVPPGAVMHPYQGPSQVQIEAMRQEAAHIDEMVSIHKGQMNADRKRKREAEKARKAIESGKDLIGPPSPWPDRKGRWV